MQLHLHRTKRLKSESFEAQFFFSQIVLWTKISFEWSSNNISSNSNNQNAFKRSCITPTNATQATLCVHASLITDSHTVKPSDSLIVAKLIAELNLYVKATNNLKACRGTNDVELGASQNVGQSVKLSSTRVEPNRGAQTCIGLHWNESCWRKEWLFFMEPLFWLEDLFNDKGGNAKHRWISEGLLCSLAWRKREQVFL